MARGLPRVASTRRAFMLAYAAWAWLPSPAPRAPQASARSGRTSLAPPATYLSERPFVTRDNHPRPHL
eukprot:9286723-Pyramimonas_sp.AAC.1